MSKFKEVTGILLVSALSAALAACGSTAGPGSSASTVSSTSAASDSDSENNSVVAETSSSSAAFSSATEESTDKSGTIRLLSFSEYHDAIQAAIDAYMKQNPNVTVELEEYPYAQYNDAVSIKLGSGSSDFDVILTDATMVSSYAFKGWITPLTDYFTQDELALYTPALVQSGTYDGQFYSAPLCNSCQVLWYNKDLLSAAGYDDLSADPKDRLTWEEVVVLTLQKSYTKNL